MFGIFIIIGVVIVVAIVIAIGSTAILIVDATTMQIMILLLLLLLRGGKIHRLDRGRRFVWILLLVLVVLVGMIIRRRGCATIGGLVFEPRNHGSDLVDGEEILYESLWHMASYAYGYARLAVISCGHERWSIMGKQ